MQRIIVLAAAALPLTATFLRGQDSICEVFKDLQAADRKYLIVAGELIISKDFAALGAADCEARYATVLSIGRPRVVQAWPTAVHLRPSEKVSAKQIQQFHDAAAEADRLRNAGKTVNASGKFSGRLRIAEWQDLPGELTFDSFEDLKVATLPDPSELPVIPICELFQNLPAWKGKRIAVRGERSSTFEGAWLSGRCKGSFYTNGYRWPVSLSYGGPAYYSSSMSHLVDAKQSSDPPKGAEAVKGKPALQAETWVGRLRMRDEYTAECGTHGWIVTNGFGHMGAAAAEIIVEAITDVELAPATASTGTELEDYACGKLGVKTAIQ
jgi:hypothetical protein